MKTLAISSFFVLFAIAAGAVTPAAYADHPTATVSMPAGTSIQGCEETNECFIPADVSVDVGGEVTWSNDDTAAHTVSSGTVGGADGKFDSGLFLAGTTFSHTFDEAGEYPYFCLVHPWMVGSVTVMADGMMHDKMDDHGDKMMRDGMVSASGMLSDSTEIKIMASEATEGEMMEITVKFKEKEHVNYDIMVTQNGNTVLEDIGAHEHGGIGTHMTAPLESADPVDVTIMFQGFGVDEKTGPIGEEVVFTNIVPEFGTIAAMILAVAIVSIVAVTARSRLSLTPRI